MTVDIICADARDGLARFPDGHFHCCVMSPPFWGLRDYGLEPTVWGGDGCEHEWGSWQESHDEREQSQHGKTRTTDRFYGDESRRFDGNHQKHSAGAFCRRCSAWRGTLGLEPTPELYVEHLVGVLREVRRTLRPDGTLWLNLGDSYASQGGHASIEDDGRQNRAMRQMMTGIRASGIGLKPKDLVGVPWRVAFALQADGWWLRSDIVWSKPNPMPESVTDRPTRSHEYLFLLAKSQRYHYDQDAIREPNTINPDWNYGSENYRRDITQDEQKTDGDFRRPKSSGAGWSGFAPAGPTGSGRNRRSVWTIATQPFGLEMCGSCRTIYTPAQYRRLRGGSAPRCTYEIGEDDQCCGTKWLGQDGGAVCVSCETFYSAKGLERLPRAAKCRKCGAEEWLSHFAVFPEKLVEPCILAGTSEHGCCPECGAPWERVVEKATEPHPNRWSKQADAKQFNQDDGDYGKAGSLGVAHTSTTLGWRPICKHGAEPVPCRVLDPFSGSGTVGVVAERLGRHSVLIDAKEEYCEMARHRTAQRGLMVEAAP